MRGYDRIVLDTTRQILLMSVPHIPVAVVFGFLWKLICLIFAACYCRALSRPSSWLVGLSQGSHSASVESCTWQPQAPICNRLCLKSRDQSNPAEFGCDAHKLVSEPGGGSQRPRLER